MSDAFITIGFLSLFVLPIFLIIWIVQAFRKKSTKIIKRICLALIAAFIIFEVLGYATQCKHQWINASCSAPKICSLCGETEGEPLDHRWDKATCTKPKTCVVCGQTKGEALGHHWVEATCSAPKTCSRCGATEGEALPHTPGDPEPAADYVNAVYTVTSVCTVCGDIVEQESVPMISLLNDGKFLFSADEFSQRLDKLFSSMGYSSFDAFCYDTNDMVACAIMHSTDQVGTVGFLGSDGELLTSNQVDEHDVKALMVKMDNDNPDAAILSIVGVVAACDSSLDEDEADDVRYKIVEASQRGSGYELNDIKYTLAVYDDLYILLVTPSV